MCASSFFSIFFFTIGPQAGTVLVLCPQRRSTPLLGPCNWSPVRQKKNLLKALPPLSYLLFTDQSVCVFGRLDIHPLYLFFFLENRHLLGSVMTPTGQWQLRPGCTYPKESGLAGRITRQSCNKALTGEAPCPLASARTGAQSNSMGFSQIPHHVPVHCATWTRPTLWETKACLMSDHLLHGLEWRLNTLRQGV